MATMLISTPFAIAAAIVYMGGNCYAAIGVGWFLMLTIVYALGSNGGVLGDDK